MEAAPSPLCVVGSLDPPPPSGPWGVAITPPRPCGGARSAACVHTAERPTQGRPEKDERQREGRRDGPHTAPRTTALRSSLAPAAPSPCHLHLRHQHTTATTQTPAARTKGAVGWSAHLRCAEVDRMPPAVLPACVSRGSPAAPALPIIHDPPFHAPAPAPQTRAWPRSTWRPSSTRASSGPGTPPRTPAAAPWQRRVPACPTTASHRRSLS